jgi:hypothetical protein
VSFASEGLIQPRTPQWTRYLNQRMPGETPHVDDQWFRSTTVPGTEVAPAGTRTWTAGSGMLGVTLASVGPFDIVGRVFPMTPSSFPVTIETSFSFLGAASSNNAAVSLGFSDGTSDSSNIQGFQAYAPSRNPTVYEIEGTFTTVVFSTSTAELTSDWNRLYMRCVWTANDTVELGMSTRNAAWTNLGRPAHVRNSSLTPTHFFVGAYSTPTLVSSVVWDYIRVTEADLSP